MNYNCNCSLSLQIIPKHQTPENMARSIHTYTNIYTHSTLQQHAQTVNPLEFPPPMNAYIPTYSLTHSLTHSIYLLNAQGSIYKKVTIHFPRVRTPTLSTCSNMTKLYTRLTPYQFAPETQEEAEMEIGVGITATDALYSNNHACNADDCVWLHWQCMCS